MNANGSAKSPCGQFSSFAIDKGMLRSGDSLFSTSSGSPFSLFVLSTSPGDITTTFAIAADSRLSWTNETFDGGQARFCLLGSGNILAVFQADAAPPGCRFIYLSVAQGESSIHARTMSGQLCSDAMLECRRRQRPERTLWSQWRRRPNWSTGSTGACWQ